MTDKIAKVIRVITIPPVLVVSLFLLLCLKFDTYFNSVFECILGVFFLAIVPALAYPFQLIVPKFRSQGRDGQRRLAFVFTGIGYIIGTVSVMLSQSTGVLKSIYLGYLISYLLLILFNKIIKIKASGHAAGITGPLLYMAWYATAWTLPISIVLYFSIIWSSVKIKRHTVSEFILGTACSTVAFLISLLLSLYL